MMRLEAGMGHLVLPHLSGCARCPMPAPAHASQLATAHTRVRFAYPGYDNCRVLRL